MGRVLVEKDSAQNCHVLKPFKMPRIDRPGCSGTSWLLWDVLVALGRPGIKCVVIALPMAPTALAVALSGQCFPSLAGEVSCSLSIIQCTPILLSWRRENCAAVIIVSCENREHHEQREHREHYEQREHREHLTVWFAYI